MYHLLGYDRGLFPVGSAADPSYVFDPFATGQTLRDERVFPGNETLFMTVSPFDVPAV